jgi:hypothetical protein
VETVKNSVVLDFALCKFRSIICCGVVFFVGLVQIDFSECHQLLEGPDSSAETLYLWFPEEFLQKMGL